MWLKQSHGMGDAGYLRPPFWKRATNVSRSGKRFKALPASGVRFGGANHTARSTFGRFLGSIATPPENSGPFTANVNWSRGEWHPLQLPTARARYSPRSRVAFDGGDAFAG